MPQYRPRELTLEEARERGLPPRFTVTTDGGEEFDRIAELKRLLGMEDGHLRTTPGPFTFEQVWALLQLSHHREARVEVWPRGWTPEPLDDGN